MSGHNKTLGSPKMGGTTPEYSPVAIGLLTAWVQVPGHANVWHI